MKSPTDKWFTEFTGARFFGIGSYTEDDIPPTPHLDSILSLDRSELKPFAKSVLGENKFRDSLADLARAVQVYSEFQEILGIKVAEGANPEEEPLLNRHYCYYESLVYLREGIVSWLDGNFLAAFTLMRPFLELAVLHVYWHLRCDNRSYRPFYRWFRGEKGKPPFKQQFDFIFEQLLANGHIDENRLDVTRSVLQNTYINSCAYNHTPRIEESIVTLGGGIGQVSLFSFYYYLSTIQILLRQLIFLYVIVYPMSLFPVDRYRKWGFGGPLGVFFDRSSYLILKQYLEEDAVHELQKQLQGDPDVITLLEWVEQFSDLSNEQITASWQEFCRNNNADVDTKVFGQRVAYYKAFKRALGWAVNYTHSPTQDTLSDEKVDQLNNLLHKW